MSTSFLSQDCAVWSEVKERRTQKCFQLLKSVLFYLFRRVGKRRKKYRVEKKVILHKEVRKLELFISLKAFWEITIFSRAFWQKRGYTYLNHHIHLKHS